MEGVATEEYRYKEIIKDQDLFMISHRKYRDIRKFLYKKRRKKEKKTASVKRSSMLH